MRIGNWDIIKIIADGRWSKIALAKPHGCQSNNADYIIKFVDEDSTQFEFARNMLLRELACSKLVSHPSVISFLDGDPEHKTPYLVSARHSGENLQQFQSGYQLVFDLRDKLTCFRQVCEGVMQLHQIGIRHGDLSPANTLVDIEGRKSLILDLGLSEKVNPFFREREATAGTWGYVAPECLQDSTPVNLSADVFSLGATMKEFFPVTTEFANDSSTYAPVRHALGTLLESMTDRQPLKRPAIQEVTQQASMLEIGCIELDYRSAS